MDISIITEDKTEYLLIKTKGTLVTKEDLFRHADMIYAEVVKSGSKKILIEVTETSLPLDKFNYYELVDTWYQNHFPFEIRYLHVAVVVAVKYLSVAGFWETLCNNRGFRYLAFTDIGSARQWLTELK